jgi:hypothetical protein
LTKRFSSFRNDETLRRDTIRLGSGEQARLAAIAPKPERRPLPMSYFLINNGPYLFNYDLPLDRQHQNWNLFFYPGPARTWICRSPLGYDKWIPSVLFLTHYPPDDPESSQLVNVGSLILGQSGIWGDLPAVSSEGVQRIGDILQRYKRVREDITESDPIVTGPVSSSPVDRPIFPHFPELRCSQVVERWSGAGDRGAVDAGGSCHRRIAVDTSPIDGASPRPLGGCQADPE